VSRLRPVPRRIPDWERGTDEESEATAAGESRGADAATTAADAAVYPGSVLADECLQSARAT